MRILAIECSLPPGNLAALAEENLAVRRDLDPQRRTTQTLTPAIADLLTQMAWRPADVQLVAVTTGPGSFTGLRVGVTTAKTFAYATGCAVRGINTLRVLAQQAIDSFPPAARPKSICAIMDAQRGELFAGYFQVGEHPLALEKPVSLLDRDSWLADLPRGAVVCGPVLHKLGRLPADVRLAPAESWVPDAGTLARLARQDYLDGQVDDVWELAPVYYRRSAAEEKFFP